MKTYQVVRVSEHRADRNEERLYFNNTQSASTVMEIILNWYAQDGWELKGVSSTGDYVSSTAIYLVFEKEQGNQ